MSKDGEKLKMFVPGMGDLPVTIHGKEGSGASYFSIQFVAEMAKNKTSLTFWSAYSMAKDELRKALKGSGDLDINIIESGDPVDLSATLEKINDNQVLFVKNFESVPDKLREKLLHRKLLIISGDMEEVLTKDQILNFPTRIFFSPYQGIKIPALKKYQGWVFKENK